MNHDPVKAAIGDIHQLVQNVLIPGQQIVTVL